MPPKDYDAKISSFGRLYLAYMSLVLLLFYSATLHVEHLRAVAYLPSLDTLLAIRQLGKSPPNSEARPLRRQDAPNFFGRASTEARAPWPGNRDPWQYELLAKRGFDETSVPQAVLSDGIVMRNDGGMTCEAAIVTLGKGGKFNFATFEVVAKTYWVESENTQLVTLGCAQSEFNFMLFRSGSDVVVGLPGSFQDSFPGLKPPPPFQSFEFHQMEELKELLPEFVRHYAALDETYVTMHIRALEHYIIRYANQRHGRLYSLTDFDMAAENLFQETERRAQFYGVATDAIFVMRLIPPMLFLLAWEMWRRLRQLPATQLPTKVYWTPLDASDRLGRLAAHCYALGPLVAGVLAMLAFVGAQGLALRIGQYLISPFHGAVPSTITPFMWRHIVDPLATAYASMAIVFLILLTAIALRLRKAITANRSPSKRRSAAAPWRRAYLRRQSNRSKKRPSGS